MEPQPGSPPPPSSAGTPSPEIAEIPTPSEEMPPSDEPEGKEEEAGVKPDNSRRSSSSSSSSSEASGIESNFHPEAAEISIPLVVVASPDDEAVVSGAGLEVRPDDDGVVASGAGLEVRSDDKAVSPGDGAEVRPDDKAVASGDGAEVRSDDWASWPQQPAQTVDVDPLVTDGGEVLPGLTQAPEVQTMPRPATAGTAAASRGEGFDPERIPASIFQAKPPASSSQAEWSVASNESLFSIHGARQSTDLCGFYAGESRSHFDYFYDEAMAAAGGAESELKLATVAEGSEPADATDAAGGHGAKELAVPGSAKSDASGGSDRNKQKAIAFRRHESGSAGSSSNFSFAFPILPETTTSPRKRDNAGGGAMYQPLQKEYEQQPVAAPLPSRMSAFEEMTTEEERRRRTGWFCCCGECCGCCWFACSWSSCCCCCRWRRRWWCCDCRCSSCPSLCCRCNWCLCF